MPLETTLMETGKLAATKPLASPSTLDALDKRTRPYRRFLAIRDAIVCDMGGMDRLSEVQRQMVGKFATLAIQLEAMEAEALAGGEIDVDLFGRAAGHMRRLAELIGIERKAKDITPSLHEYARRVNGGG